MGDRELDERHDAERGPPGPFPLLEKAVLPFEGNIAVARVVLLAANSDEWLALEGDFDPLRESYPQRDVEGEPALVGLTARSRPCVFHAALDLESAGRDGAGALGDAGTVDLDAVRLAGESGGGAPGRRRAQPQSGRRARPPPQSPAGPPPRRPPRPPFFLRRGRRARP